MKQRQSVTLVDRLVEAAAVVVVVEVVLVLILVLQREERVDKADDDTFESTFGN